MNLTTDIQRLQRKALDGYLRTLRTPIDTLVGWLPGEEGEESARATVALTVDRADALVRDVVGRVWRDDELTADALRRRAAADERARALRLKAEAKERSEEADDEFRRRREVADRRRIEAAEQAETQRERIEAGRQAEKRRVAEQAARRQASVRKLAASVEASVDAEARDARLEQLDEEAEALAKEKAAVATANEAKRLRKAASKAKTSRKQASSA